MELTTFQSEGEDGVVFDVEVGPDESDVEETGVAMVGGEKNVGVVDVCVEFPLEGGRERDDDEVLKVGVAVDDSGVLVEDAGGVVVDIYIIFQRQQ